jgi:multidrug efflux pump subunit AcrA (membrane-fusion protein)
MNPGRSNMSRPWIGFGATLWLLIGVSCSAPEKLATEEKRTIQAHVDVLQLSTVADTFPAPGTVRARTATVLSSLVSGRILFLQVREGDVVRAGQVVAEVESRDATAQLRRARAGVEEAQRGLDEAEAGIRAAEAAVRQAESQEDLALSTQKRYDVLRDRRSISPQEYDEVAARSRAAALETERAGEALSAAKAGRLRVLSRIEQAEAAAESAAAAQEHTRIVSPIDGVVTRRAAEPGMSAIPGVPLLTIEDPRTYELEVAVEESRVSVLRKGRCVRVEIDAAAGVLDSGCVREIAPSAEPRTRTYSVKLSLAGNAAGALRSGLFGRAFFPAGNRQALVVPDSAVIRRGQLEGIYVVVDGIAVLRLVKTGKAHEQGLEILSGLMPGTRILSAPTAEIADGMRIADAGPSGATP